MEDINVKIVYYKGVEYSVYSPGILLRNEKGRLFDQLRPDLRYMGRYHSVYIKNNYNLTDYDYYVIVVCGGDENNIPRCELEGCNNPRQFNSLGVAKKIPTLSTGCCVHHTRVIARKNSWIKWKSMGINPAIDFGAKRKWTEEQRQEHSAYLKQLAREGKHQWCKENSQEFRKKAIADGKNPIVNYWNLVKKIRENNNPSKEDLEKLDSFGFKFDFNKDLDLFNPKKMTDLSYVLKSERESFKHRDNPDDICYFYITDLSEELFKIGVSKNVNNRIKATYHEKYKYHDTEVLFSGTRNQVADLEYNVKVKFFTKLALGTETFNKKHYSEIREYIDQEILKILE